MNKAGLWLHISWFAFLLFCFPFFAFADATFEIPYTMGSDGSVTCDIPLNTYNASISFYSYSVTKDDVLATSGSTSGKGMCQGSFFASTLDGGSLFFETGAGAGEYRLTLYSESGLRDPYGYMVFVCPEDGVCEPTKLTDTKTWYGILASDTVWTKSGNPYLVDQLTINPGVTLTIDKGVVVKFRNKASFLYVESGAKLKVNGTADEKVYFTTIKDDTLLGDTGGDADIYPPAPGGWDNIQNYGVLDSTNLEIRYANIGMVNQAGGEIKLDQTYIKDSRIYGVLSQSDTKITNSKITGGEYGIYQVSGSTHLFNSSIYDQSILGVNNAKGNFNAMHNYWGNATGPHLKFSNEPSGNGEDISNEVAYIPWLNAEPTENRYMGCVVDCFSNVMFLPGMMASRLYEAGEEIWFTRNEGEQNKMGLNSEGKSEYTVYTKDDTRHEVEGENETGITDEVLGFNIYKSFTEDLRKWKTADNLFKDYALVPYDWRLSLPDIVNNGQVTDGKLSYGDTTAGGQYIIKQLEALAQDSRTGKVTIVAHSNGGLVAKYLINKLQTEGSPLVDKIDKLILVAVPQTGTPESFVTLLHGVKVSEGFVMDADTSRFLAENFPVMYNLLPTDAYFSTVDTNQSPLITFEDVDPYASQVAVYGTEITTPDELKGYILGTDGRTKPDRNDTKHPNIGNDAIYKQAKETHDIIDNWQPPAKLKITQVAGWGEETKSNLEYVERTYLGGIKRTTVKVNTTIDGDHTVVEPSALWMSPNTNSNIERWWVNLDIYNENNFPDREHKDILEVKNLRDFVKDKIKGKTLVDPENIILSTKPISDSSDKRLHFTLHSPLTLGIYDSEGRYSGLDPVTMEVRNEIPGVYYEQIGDVQFLSIPTGVEFTLKLDGLEDGSFALDVDEQSGNSITASTIFEGIPSGADTVVTIEIGQEFKVGESVLKIDKENDGTIDVTLTATPYGRTVYKEPKVEPVEEPEEEVKEEPKEEAPPVVIAPSTSRSVVPVWMLNQPTSSPSPVVAVSTPIQESIPEPVVSEPVKTENSEPEVLGQAKQEYVEEVAETITEDTSEDIAIPTEFKTETIPLTASVGETPGLPYQKLLFVVLSLLGILLGFRFIKG
ncbi:MAG: hypothetical protein KBC12_02570 [Candidatus Pacebacteria bacterium]|nr:hypothetical protein [Candidatus Paceibacterota bacterium]